MNPDQRADAEEDKEMRQFFEDLLRDEEWPPREPPKESRLTKKINATLEKIENEPCRP